MCPFGRFGKTRAGTGKRRDDGQKKQPGGVKRGVGKTRNDANRASNSGGAGEGERDALRTSDVLG